MTARPEPATYIGRALERGATSAVHIQARSIVTAQWVRWKCQFGCGGYGKRLTCPPHTPTPDETAALLSEYEDAILVHCRRQKTITALVSALEREAFLDGYHRAFAMGSGPCRLCDPCPLGNVCQHAAQARPAMEACGIDVFATARAAGLPIQVVQSESSEQDYYGLLLLGGQGGSAVQLPDELAAGDQVP